MPSGNTVPHLAVHGHPHQKPRGVADTVNRQRQLEQWATNKWQRPDEHQGMDLARTKWAKIIKSRGGYSWRPPEDPTDVALDMHPVLGNWAPKAGKVAPAASARSNRRTAPHSTGGTASARGAEGGSEPKRRSMSQRLSALRRSREVAGDSVTQTFDLGLDAEFEEEGVVLDKKGFVVLRGGEFIVDGVHLPEAAVPEELKHQPHLLRRYAQSVAFARSDVAAGDSRGSSSPSRSMRTPGHVVTAALAGFGYNSSGGSDIRLGADTGSMAQQMSPPLAMPAEGGSTGLQRLGRPLEAPHRPTGTMPPCCSAQQRRTGGMTPWKTSWRMPLQAS